MKKLALAAAIGCVGLFGQGPAQAAVLDSAEILWKFDYADSGTPVPAGQITDSSGNDHHATGTTNNSLLNWTTTPTEGPGGSPTVDLHTDHGRGLEFNPVVTSAGDPDTVQNGGFTAAGAAVHGSSTVMARIYWEGYVNDDPTAQMTWLLNNGHSGSGGYLFGFRNNKLALHMSSVGSFDSSQLVPPAANMWYDIAAVFDDKGDGDTANDEITLYMFAQGGELLSHTISKIIPGTGGSDIRVGSESLGTGSNNERKAFDGVVDYIAFWNDPLSAAEIQSVIIPEPGTLGMLALAGMGLLRRRR